MNDSLSIGLGVLLDLTDNERNVKYMLELSKEDKNIEDELLKFIDKLLKSIHDLYK